MSFYHIVRKPNDEPKQSIIMNKILQDLDDASHRSCSPPEPGICNGGGAPAARFSSAHVTMRKTMKMVMVIMIMENGEWQS